MTPIQIAEMTKLTELCQKIAAGDAPPMMLVGPPGQGKTETLRKALGRRPYLYLRGRVSAIMLYKRLYEHRGELVVLDDTAEMLKDRQVQELLRDLSETTPSRVISWHTQSSMLAEQQIPSSFQTSSPMCIIANEIGSDGVWPALKSRCLEVEIAFSWKELIKAVRRDKWFSDEEILTHVEKSARCVADLRLLTRASEMKRVMLGDWRQLFGGSAVPLGPAADRGRLVALIGSDPGVGLDDLHRRYGSNIKSDVLRKTLGEMVGEGVIQHKKEKTKGRPITRYWLGESDRPPSTLQELRPRKDGVLRRVLAAAGQLFSSRTGSGRSGCGSGS
jgi:hypothetical protein